MSTVKTPAENLEALSRGATKKCEQRIDRLFVSSILAGFYIGVGGCVAAISSAGFSNGVVSKIIFSALFPIALTLVVVAGSELFTGNIGAVTYGLATHTITWTAGLYNLVVSYIGNFIGSLILVYVIMVWGGIFDSDPYKTKIVAIASGKMAYTWGQAVVRGIGCNWLVNLSLWIAGFYSSLTNKFTAIWICIYSFCALGFEHSVANMTFIPLGINYGAGDWGKFIWNNLIPVTLGNIIGAVFFVCLVYWYLLNCPNYKKNDTKPIV